MKCDLQCWSNIASIITLIITTVATIVGLWGYFSYRFNIYQKQRKLEQYLQGQNKKANGQALRSLLHIVRHVGLTEDEIIQISFKSKRIDRRINTDEKGFAKSLLFVYV